MLCAVNSFMGRGFREQTRSDDIESIQKSYSLVILLKPFSNKMLCNLNSAYEFHSISIESFCSGNKYSSNKIRLFFVFLKTCISRAMAYTQPQ